MTEPPDTMLEHIATGDLASDDPAVQQRCREDEGFAREVAELVRASAALDGAAELERDVLDEARARTTPEDLAAVRDTLTRSLSSRGVERVPRWRHALPAIGVVAAAAMLLVLLWPSPVGDEDPVLPDGRLSAGDPEIRAPRGEVEAFEELLLDYDALSAFRDVEVVLTPFEGAEVLVRRDALETGTWTLKDQEREALTNAGRIRIVVTATSRLGGEPEVFRATAWLPSARPR